MLRLAVRTGRAAGLTFQPQGDVVRIGRSKTNDLVLEDVHVSSEHVRIVESSGRVVIEDLRSTNGTTIVRDGKRTPLADADGRKAVLESGDVVELGADEAVTAIDVILG